MNDILNINIPKLRFPEFEMESKDNSYNKYIFKDIFIFTTGKNIKQNEASPEFETPCIRYGELYYMYNEVIYKIVNRTNLDKSELLFSKGDEILLPSAGEDPLDIGSASSLTLKNIAIGRTINILRPMKGNIYSQNYVAYYINQKLRKKISTLAKGSSISNVYNSDLKKLEIILPNLPEQQKIAKFLTATDKKIQTLKKKKSLLEQYKKGIMQKLFHVKADGRPSIRFKPAVSEVERDNTGKDFPDWEEKKLGDLSYKVGKKNKENLKLPVYSINNIEGFLPQSDQFEGMDSNNRGYDTSLYKIIEKNTFAYNPARINVGSIGYSYDLNNIIISSLYVCFKTTELLDDFFLLQFLKTYNFNKSVLRNVEGGVRDYLFYNNFSNIKLKLPSLPEQTKIANFLSATDKKIEKTENKITQTEQWKKGFLQQMFV